MTTPTTTTIRSELARLAETLAAPRFSGSNKIRKALLAGLWDAQGDDAPATAAEISRSIFSLLKSPTPPEVEAVFDEIQLLGDIFAEGVDVGGAAKNDEVLRRIRKALGLKPPEEAASPGRELLAELAAGGPSLTFSDVAKVGMTYRYVGPNDLSRGLLVKVESVSSDAQVWGHVYAHGSGGRVLTVRTPAVDGSCPANDWKLVVGGAS